MVEKGELKGERLQQMAKRRTLREREKRQSMKRRASRCQHERNCARERAAAMSVVKSRGAS